jgi:CofD-related protein of GAK system
MKRIVMFGGGSGSRGITLALCRGCFDVTRVVPAWDSGGSSRALRQALGILAVGDIRQALMTLAHGEQRVSSVVRFFNARLSEAANPTDLRAEFDFYANGAHPLLASMAPDIHTAVLNYLRVFRAEVDDAIDFRRGSIGNFALTGAYFAHDRNINTAVCALRKLCAIRGHVWPSTTHDTVELCADLRDGRQVWGQDQVTALNADCARVGIRRVHLTCTDANPGAATSPTANPEVLDSLSRADAIVFGPGSFYTSTLAHLGVQGIAQAIAATSPKVPKVLIGNILECPETSGRSLSELVQAFSPDGLPCLLTHVLANQGWVPFERVVKGFRYVPLGDAAPSNGSAPCVIADDFEDPWNRGTHDAQKVVTSLGDILAKNSSDVEG